MVHSYLTKTTMWLLSQPFFVCVSLTSCLPTSPLEEPDELVFVASIPWTMYATRPPASLIIGTVHVSTSSPPTIWCDNLGATYLAANPVFHARTKHVEFDLHFVREKVSNRQLLVRKTTSSQQIADIFTKSLAASRFHFLRDKLTVSLSSKVNVETLSMVWW